MLLFNAPVIIPGLSERFCHTLRKHFTGLLVCKEEIPTIFLCHYPACQSKQLNVSEMARVCDISRTTVYKYIGLLEA